MVTAKSKSRDIEEINPEDVKVEDILHSLGGFSTYQRWLAFALIFPQFPTAMIVLSPVFTGSSKVPMYCKRETYFHEDDACTANCTIETSDVVYSSIVQEWDLACSSAWIVDLVTSFQMAGMMTGAFLSSLLSDQFGRKKCFYFQTICMGVLGMLPAAAIDPWSYAIARFLAGFGVGACFVIYLSHLMEFLTPAWRTICGTISFWPFGEMLLGLLAYLIVGWRWLTIIVALPALFLLLFHKTILESPRWLLIRNKTAAAHEVFATIAKWNKTAAPDIKLIEQLQVNILKEESSNIHGVKAVKMILHSSSLRTHMAILTLCNVTCAIVYYGVSFNAKNLSGYWPIDLKFGDQSLCAIPQTEFFSDFQISNLAPRYGSLKLSILEVELDHSGKQKVNRSISDRVNRVPSIGLQTAPAQLSQLTPKPKSSILFNNWIGRRKTFTLYMGLGTLFIISLLIVDGVTGLQNASSTLVTVLSLCGRFGIVAAWGALTCLILETAPTNLRSSCLGFTAFAGYLGAVVAPQIFLLSGVTESLPYIILCVLTVSSSVSSWFLRETLQQPLEDTVEKD
ncbi:Organic cation transporter protein [Orchesella cincta]|uniref:Organic cation transporter protein n=1 Tax=Orchesella cincta TaxID=48709 RepID=A0A1D2MSA5_ORCCI|nr:Organic cation transporter protein [Orchesella cincta]